VQPVDSSSPDRRQAAPDESDPRRHRGIFLLYEPTCLPGEDRPAYLDRFRRINEPLWSMLTPAEWDQIWNHVRTCDFPETAAAWRELGRSAGFGEAREVFVDQTDMYRLFRYAG
jgi:hypothetical protein